jgi:hypothetical protein
MQSVVAHKAAVVRSPAKRAPKAAPAATAPVALWGPSWTQAHKLERERWAAEQLKQLLIDIEAPPVDEPTRLQLERLVYFFGPEHVILTVRTIIESEGNEGALIGPVVGAVSSVIRLHPKWADRGDSIPLLATVETMRRLDLFQETSLAKYLAMILTNRLWNTMEPPPLPPPPRPGPKRGTRHNRNAPRYTKVKAAGT